MTKPSRILEEYPAVGRPAKLVLALTAEEAARSISVSANTFEALVTEGRMPPPIQIPGHRLKRFDAEAVRVSWEAIVEAAMVDKGVDNPWDGT